MRALKALVILMGVLIAAGLTVVVLTVLNRARAPATDTAGFGTLGLDIGAGCRVAETTATAGRLVLRTDGAPGCAAVHVLDIETGARLGTIEIRPGP